MSGSNPGWTYGKVVTPTEWNNEFALKADYAATATALAAKADAAATTAALAGKQDILTPAPPQAAAAGFTSAVFFDDFTTTNTIATSQNAASGFKWYWDFNGAPSYSVNPTQTAAGISNGNANGGANASAAGGILTLNGPNSIITVPGNALNNASAILPTTGCWLYGYFEAYLQVNVSTVVPPTGSGWPAFWSWSAEDLHGFGFGSSSLSAVSTEIDIIEIFNTQFGDAPGTDSQTIHQPAGSTVVYSNTPGQLLAATSAIQLADAGWHTYGVLWYPGGITFWRDNVQVGPTAAGPFGTGSLQIETAKQHLFLVLSTGIQTGAWMNVDWVRVWK